MNLKELTDKVLNGRQITKEEALFLYGQPLLELCGSADEIRRRFCANRFDICTIINAKSGSCSENCRFCAQSAYNHTCAASYPLLSKEEIVSQARIDHEQGVLRYSIVTSGKRLSDEEVDAMCETVREIKEKVEEFSGILEIEELLGKYSEKTGREYFIADIHDQRDLMRSRISRLWEEFVSSVVYSLDSEDETL